MPNPNFCGPHDDMNIVDCHLSKNYKGCQPAEKVCRFAYASWCPVCDLETQRKRSKSESTELNFRKRGRDNIKSPSPKKGGQTKGYFTENKEFNDNRDMKLDSSRVRTNLCELPTTYITGNCQINVPSNHEKTHSKKLFNGNLDYANIQKDKLHCAGSVSSEIASEFSSFVHNASLHRGEQSRFLHAKSADHTDRVHRHLNMSPPLEPNLSMDYKADFLKNVTKCNGVNISHVSKIRDLPVPHRDKLSPPKNKLLSAKANHIKEVHTSKPNSRGTERILAIEDEVHKKTDSQLRPLIAMHNLKEIAKAPATPPKLFTGTDRLNTVKTPSPSRDCTFLNMKYDKDFPPTLPQMLQKSVDIMKEKNTELNSSNKYVEHLPNDIKLKQNNVDTSDLKRQRVRQRSDSDNSNDQNQEKLDEIQKTVKKKAREISPLEVKKDLRSKSTVKFTSVKSRHKLSTVKLRKVRSKIAHSVSSDSNLSER